MPEPPQSLHLLFLFPCSQIFDPPHRRHCAQTLPCSHLLPVRFFWTPAGPLTPGWGIEPSGTPGTGGGAGGCCPIFCGARMTRCSSSMTCRSILARDWLKNADDQGFSWFASSLKVAKSAEKALLPIWFPGCCWWGGKCGCWPGWPWNGTPGTPPGISIFCRTFLFISSPPGWRCGPGGKPPMGPCPIGCCPIGCCPIGPWLMGCCPIGPCPMGPCPGTGGPGCMYGFGTWPCGPTWPCGIWFGGNWP
mmetsp:Transcript_18992/g.29663  ORF Transcript_18992/g.29663 Transcript_18992/m.29663 type:complete len:248 (-) Transcript_18992:107-850(-)